MNRKTKNLLKIGQMAKKAGVSAPTIKHYVNEGLLPKPVKTSKNMAYYDESCIERIRLIKRIQKERFLPLDVIKRIIDSGEAYNEDLEMGEAILKTHKVSPTAPRIKEAQIEKKTGYPKEKIRILEDEKLIIPSQGPKGKEYDEADCRIIELMKKRDAIGVRFDHSIEILRVYRDAIRQAVEKDISLFAQNTAGDVSTKQAIKLLTDADETLDSFMVNFRFKMLRTLGEEAIKETNQLPKSLKVLKIFPVEGRSLPEKPPKDKIQRCFYYICKGEFEKIDEFINLKAINSQDLDLLNFSILSDILADKLEVAREKVIQHMPKPLPYALNNAVAALAYLFSIGTAGGFSIPMFNAKKMLSYLVRIESSAERHIFSMDIARFVCGVIYITLPGAINKVREGVELLSQLNWSEARKKLDENSYPDWLVRTIDYEIIPAFDLCIHRFLAKGYRKLGETEKALRHLNDLISLADPDSEWVSWAGMQRLLITK